MIKFNTCKLDPKILDQWVSTDVNVLLIGEKGVGKSHQIIDTFKRNNLKYSYFSGATLDPWIHLLGIPKAKVQPDGTEKMEFILPENLDNDVEAIFCDEWNRTNKVVRNALLELQQFKSINGRKFPNLRMVWGAVNPSKADDEDGADYDVDELDPAQLDRFHIIVELPNKPDLKYFKDKYGNYHGKILVDWWEKQSKESYKILSPRRLDYIGECFKKGLDVKYLLPVSANSKDLIRSLSLDEASELINQMLENPTEDSMKEFMSDDKNFLKYKGKLKNGKYWKYWKYINKEFLIDEIKTNQEFEDFAIYKVLEKDSVYREAMVEISKSNPSNMALKIIKSLVDQKYTPDALVEKGVTSDKKQKFTTNKSSSKTDSFSVIYPWNNITLPTFYKPSDNIYFMNTQERRKALTQLQRCFDVVNNKYHAVNFIVSCLISMQKGTLAGEQAFLPLLGSACIWAKDNFKSDDLNHLKMDLNMYKSKISSNRVEDFVEFLGGTTTSEYSTCVPESFTRKLRDIRAVLNISTDNSEILNLLAF